jgi:hypothetical protein
VKALAFPHSDSESNTRTELGFVLADKRPGHLDNEQCNEAL